ncbi:MAG: hypothetical protein R2751_08920 [Bacteroidales bacterium]
MKQQNKRRPLWLALLLAWSLVPAGAQQTNRETLYTSAMEDALSRLRMARTAEEYLPCANRFERIARAEKDRWLPYYYSAYALILQTYEMEVGPERDPVLDRAQELLDQAFDLAPEESELFVLQAFLLPSRILVDPMSRGMALLDRVFSSLNRAKSLDPENPRIYFLEGMNRINLPAAMGGGEEEGLALLRKALDLYENQSDLPFLAPDWGEEAVRQELMKRGKLPSEG